MKLTLPFPPSVNRYWGSRVVVPADKRKKPFVSTYVTAEGKAYKAHVMATVLQTVGRVCLGGRLAVSVVAHAKTRRKYDVDNLGKALLDAMEDAGVYVNDNQIDDYHVIRGDVDPANPRVEVTIRDVA